MGTTKACVAPKSSSPHGCLWPSTFMVASRSVLPVHVTSTACAKFASSRSGTGFNARWASTTETPHGTIASVSHVVHAPG